MSEEIVVDGKNGKREKRGSTAPLDGAFAKWLERQFRGGEAPTSIDVYPLHRGRDREQRLYHYDIKADENVNTERAVEISNEIFSDCQIHCDRLPRTAMNREGTKNYEVSIIDERRGGLAQPVGTWPLSLLPRIHGAAPLPGDDDEDLNHEDSETLTTKKMMLEVFKETLGRDERGQATMAVMGGEVMMLLKEGLKDSFSQNRELHLSQLQMMDKFREMIEILGKKTVEEKAVAIDAANAEVDREMKRATLMKENMWTNVMQAGMLEGVKVLGHLFPGFGQLFSALLQGKTPPPPPQLPTNGTNGTQQPAMNGAQTQPQLPPASEKALIDRFIETAEKTKLDDNFTIGEKLFGKDDKDGKTIEPGIFTREQVSILTGIHVGTVPIEALDGLLPTSSKPEAIGGLQMAKAMAILTPDMVSDISKVLEMRNSAKK
jgi:hypothetical protein